MMLKEKVALPVREGYSGFPGQIQNLFSPSPVREFSQIRENMVELLNQLFQGTDHRSFLTQQPPINMYLEEEELVVEALVPGCNKNEIHVHATPQTLTITGEIVREKEPRTEQFFWNEFGSSRRYYRHVQLPVEVKTENIDAQLRNGILRLRLPVLEAAYARSVSISIK